MRDIDKMLDVLRDHRNILGEIVVKSRHDEILELTFDEISIHNSAIVFSFNQDDGTLSHVYP